mmetsp:Transcript_32658/g.29541  ORF Transcript_32658/g.29541 Transcript_32658/m.29541 type:complete len:151 (-) Transcript_32658:81-533(-)
MFMPGIGGAIGLRLKYFTEEFMDANFGELHWKEIGRKIEKGGYPDQGNGIYAQKLPYDQWLKFNIAQRTHQHILEMIGFQIPLVLLAATGSGLAAAICGWALVIGRIVYTMGYLNEKKGPNARQPGMVIMSIAALVLVGFAIKGCIDMIL